MLDNLKQMKKIRLLRYTFKSQGHNFTIFRINPYELAERINRKVVAALDVADQHEKFPPIVEPVPENKDENTSKYYAALEKFNDFD